MTRSQRSTVGIHIILIIGAIFILFPFVWILLTSLKGPEEITQYPPTIFPKTVITENYKAVLTIEQFPRFLFNSLLISLTSMSSVLVTSMLGGYAFAKYQFPLKKILFTLILATAIVNGCWTEIAR